MMTKGLERMAECHPDRPHEAHGLCKACYENKRIYEDYAKHEAKKIRDKLWRDANKKERIPRFKKSDGPPKCHPDRKYYGRDMCHQCYNKWWRHEQCPNYYRNHNAKQKYGLTPEEHTALLAKGVCDLCGKVPKLGKIRNLVIDHDHETGKTRGVLCRHCNSSLGWVEKHVDSIEAYLGRSLKARRANDGVR